MQIESHATPPSSSPQLRYAALHRSIERGMASDEVWRELAEVCLQLGHRDESLSSVKQIENATLRSAMESRLARLGARTETKAVETKTAVDRPIEAPTASDVGSSDHAEDEVGPGNTKEHLGDAMQYLLLQHMPLLALVTTLSFPLLVGVGGFLTAGRSFLLLAGIAALPGLLVLSLVGAMGRRILRNSFEGSNDVPAVGDLGRLFDDAQRFLADAGLVLGTFIAPPVIALLLGAPLSTTLPGLVVGGLFAPMAWALRNLRGDYASLSPVLLMRAASRFPLQYFELAVCSWMLFAPAALTTWVVLDRPIWVQIAMVGPLAVLPFFIASRLLGTWFETRRKAFGAILIGTKPAAKPDKPTPPSGGDGPRGQQPKAPPSKAATARPPQAKAPQTRAPQPRPRAPQPRAPQPQATAKRQPVATKPANAPKLPPRPDQLRIHDARDVHESRTAPAPTSVRRSSADPRPAPARQADAAAQQRREIEGRSPRRGLRDQPDLSHMPGAVVVKGQDRARKGAAARPS